MISFQWRNQLCFRHCMGFYHFYVAAWPLSGQTSVNALRRAYIISTGRGHRGDSLPCDVSMPSGGLIPFLRQDPIPLYYELSSVNALWRAYTISTKMTIVEAREMFGGVNALWRAYTISTLPPQKPFIYAGFQPQFCR